MALRIKGQEVTIRVTQAGVFLDQLNRITSFDFAAKMELKEEGFLGETTNRYDEIYNGCSFSFEVELNSDAALTWQKAVESKARNITPDVLFSISAILSFPDGTSKALLIPDAHFGEFGTNIASRGDYMKLKVTGGASEYKITDL